MIYLESIYWTLDRNLPILRGGQILFIRGIEIPGLEWQLLETAPLSQIASMIGRTDVV